MSKDVRGAFCRMYKRFMARREANTIRRCRHRLNRNNDQRITSGTEVAVMMEQSNKRIINCKVKVELKVNQNLYTPLPSRSASLLSVSPILSSSHSQQTFVEGLETPNSRSSLSSPSLSLRSVCWAQENATVLNNTKSRKLDAPTIPFESYWSGFEGARSLSPDVCRSGRRMMLESRLLENNHYDVVAIPMVQLSSTQL